MPAERVGVPSATRVLFGPFELNTAERSLRKAGEVVPVGGRAFDILTALVDRGWRDNNRRFCSNCARVWNSRAFGLTVARYSGPTISLSPSTGNSPKVSRRLI